MQEQDRRDAASRSTKTRKVRARISCTECVKRKQRCNKIVPCNQCTDRNIKHLCRIHRSEGISSAGTSSPTDRQLADRSVSTPRVAQEAGLSYQPDVDLGRLDVYDVRSFPLRGNDPNMLSDPKEHPLSAQCVLLFEEAGQQCDDILQLVRELPSEDHMDALIDCFLQENRVARFSLDEQFLLSNTAQLRRKAFPLDYETLSALPLLQVVLAYAQLWIDDDTNEAMKARSAALHRACQRSSQILLAVQPESTQFVVSHLMSSSYLLYVLDQRIPQAWIELGIAVRIALAIGLNRESTSTTIADAEHRRRLWVWLNHEDKTLSLLLRRPYQIMDSMADIRPPTVVNPYPAGVGRASDPEELTRPSPFAYLICCRDLTSIMARVIAHWFCEARQADFSEVTALQRLLSDFRDSMPRFFCVDDPDMTFDKECPWLPVHRFYVSSEMQLLTMMLNRPWILDSVDSNILAVARATCFQAALVDFQTRRDVQSWRRIPIGGQFQGFNGAKVAGISAILEPEGSNGAQMRAILIDYLERCPDSGGSLIAKKKKTIQLLASRAFEQFMLPDSLEDGIGPLAEAFSSMEPTSLSCPADVKDTGHDGHFAEADFDDDLRRLLRLASMKAVSANASTRPVEPVNRQRSAAESVEKVLGSPLFASLRNDDVPTDSEGGFSAMMLGWHWV